MYTDRKVTQIAGLLYMIIIAGGIFAQLFVLEKLTVHGDPATTAANIIQNELLFRLGFVAHCIIILSALYLWAILYFLFRNTNPLLAICMLIFNVLSLSIESMSLLYQYEALLILKNGVRISVSPEEVHSLAYQTLSYQSVGYDLALLFFGVVCILAGFLIIKSKLFPWFLGILMAFAGGCYLVNSLTHFLVPHLSAYLLPYILVPCFLGELAFGLWLLIKGANRTHLAT